MLKRLFLILMILGQNTVSADSKTEASSPLSPESLIEENRKFLIKEGVSRDFIGELELIHTRKKNWIEKAHKIIEPNLFGFLYQGNYLNHDSKRARKKISAYLLSHYNSFATAKKKYHVAPESIAALLWVETKLGTDMGSHPVAFVFYSIALAAQNGICDEMMKMAEEKLDNTLRPDKPDLPTALKKVSERCKTKAKWAASELKVLASLHENKRMNAFGLKGSFAGAFGIPQFLPSSYEKYAVSTFRKKPNLFLISDSILSVGNFLKQNGWKDESEDSQTHALYAYNRSKEYGTVIRKIAEELDEI